LPGIVKELSDQQINTEIIIQYQTKEISCLTFMASGEWWCFQQELKIQFLLLTVFCEHRCAVKCLWAGFHQGDVECRHIPCSVCSGVTTGPQTPQCGGPRAYGSPKLWHLFFFTENLTQQFSCRRALQ